MSTPQHPASLNFFQRFGQANFFFKRTSRAKNPAWYQQALDLDFQLHIRTDGVGAVSFLYNRREDLWSGGPVLTEAQLGDPEAMTACAGEAVKHIRSSGGTSLGIVLHIADEFALTEIKPEFEDRDVLADLRAAVVHSPSAILADSIDPTQSSWRIVPYFAPDSPSIATAVTLSRNYQPLLDAFRSFGEKEDFPIITHALSAPLVALLGIHGSVKPTPDHPSVVILQYSYFTVLAFFNNRSDLLLLRTQLHRGLRRPPDFRHTIATTNASLELVDPDVFVFPLGEDVDRALATDLAITFPKCHVEIVTPPGNGSLPNWCAECLISTRAPEEEGVLPGITFHALREERWSLQDFLPPSNETAEIFPTRSEMQLFRGLRYARFAAAAVGILAVAWMIYGIFTIAGTPEWAFESSETNTIKARLATLNLEKQKTEHWDSLLDDRSKAWVSIESLSRLFPENSGFLVKSYTHAARPDATPGQAKIGFVKEWKITGLMREESLELLNALNTREGIAAHFNEVARVTGNSAFRTDVGTRSVVVNIRTQENSGYKPNGQPAENLGTSDAIDETNYPFSFDLAITQRFEATDPLAVILSKAP